MSIESYFSLKQNHTSPLQESVAGMTTWLAMVYIVMPMTWSIADGIAASCLVFVVVKVLSGRHRDVSPIMAGLAALFLLRFVWL